MANASEIFKDKRVVAGVAVVALLAIAGGAFYMFSGGGGGGGAAEGTPAGPPPGLVQTPPPVPGAQAGAPAGNPGSPGAPAGSAPGAPTVAGAAPKKPAGPLRTSFDGAPGAGDTGTPAAGGGTPPAAGGAGGGALDKLPPIVRGKIGPNRPDPFVSYRIFKPEQAPAFSIAIPLRLASRPIPKDTHTLITDPELLKGPLPYVERRVAGILYDGSVSAILETGTPGSSGTDVRVVQPGQTVPSGIPGEPDLTVASITPSTLLLRAEDGRTVSVKLTAVPAAYSEAFHQAVSGGGNPGGGVPGAPGIPGAPGAPGAFGGGVGVGAADR